MLNYERKLKQYERKLNCSGSILGFSIGFSVLFQSLYYSIPAIFLGNLLWVIPTAYSVYYLSKIRKLEKYKKSSE